MSLPLTLLLGRLMEKKDIRGDSGNAFFFEDFLDFRGNFRNFGEKWEHCGVVC